MKKLYLLAGMAAMMLASCSTDEQSGSGYVPGSKVTLNASLPNSGTRVSEASSDAYGLITNWSSDDALDVLVNSNTIVSMAKGNGNSFTATPADATVSTGFNAGKTIYGVNNKANDNITTALNGSQLTATLDFTGQDGTVGNLAKYDLMYGKGDPTGNITFNHKICVLRLDITSDQLKNDGITSLTGLKLKYVATSGTQLFASQETYNFGATCDSTITAADLISLNNTNIPVADGKATVYIAVPNRQNLNGTLYIHLKGSNGTVSNTYDLTNTISMTNARMLMSTVHPLMINALSRTAVNVGDYLYSDGSWGSLADSFGATPIAVIFSNATSTTDQGHNWTHGYAMALKDAATGITWGPEGTNPTGTFFTTPTTMIADKDGYTHTTFINSTTYPAAYAAATTYNTLVAAPSNTSGWYLPSCGQWYDICVNLGKIPTNWSNYNSSDYWLLWSGQSSSCASNINAYLTPLTSGTYDTFNQDLSGAWENIYWSSAEFDNTSCLYARFSSYNELTLGAGYIKSVNTNNVRSVIAF